MYVIGTRIYMHVTYKHACSGKRVLKLFYWYDLKEVWKVGDDWDSR